MQLNLGAVRQATAQDVLLQHPVGRRHPPDDVVSQAGHDPVQALQYLQVVLDGLFDEVIVVPDDGIRSVDLTQRVDVAGFQRGEETDDKLLADGGALLHDRRLADSRAAVRAVTDAFGGLDVVVNCVGIFDFYRGLADIDDDQLDAAFDEIFTINVKSQLVSVRAALPELRRAGGSVVLTVSTSGFYPGRGGVLYVAWNSPSAVA